MMTRRENSFECDEDVEFNPQFTDVRDREAGSLIDYLRSSYVGGSSRLILVMCTTTVMILAFVVVLSSRTVSVDNDLPGREPNVGTGGFLIGYEALAVTILLLPLLLLLIALWRWLERLWAGPTCSAKFDDGAPKISGAFENNNHGATPAQGRPATDSNQLREISDLQRERRSDDGEGR